MLRKRSRTVQKEQSKMMNESSSPPSDSNETAANKAKSTSFFSVPRLFVGFGTKCLPECDAVRSPTSPLDYRVFSSLGSSLLGSPRSPSKLKCWDCCNNSRVGLGLVDSLNEASKPCSTVFPEKKNSIIFAQQMRINIFSSKTNLGGLKDETESLGSAARSMPKDYGILSPRPKQSGVENRTISSKLFDLDNRKSEVSESCSADIGGSSLPASRFMYHCQKSNSEVLPTDSKKSFVVDAASLVQEKKNFDNFEGSIPLSVDSSHELVRMLSASDIEQSEDYTCIISHGPNPRTTRIFGDCIIESHSTESSDSKGKAQGEKRPFWLLKPSEDSPRSSSGDFLSFCFSCNKKLEEGKDIYMYRGEKAFCSCDCRDQEILIDEEMEKTSGNSSDSAESSFHEEMFLEGMVMAS